jgi:hypothetical protein
MLALAGGSTEVTALDRNPDVVEILRGEYGPFTHHLYARSDVRIETIEPRTYLRRAKAKFDVIVVSLSDTYRPVTSGAYSLTEDYRYTVEAFAEYMEALDADGVLIVSRWLQTPPTESLRVLATVDEALRRLGVQAPGRHVAAFRTLRTVTFVVTADSMAPEELALIRGFASERGYDLVWLPDLLPSETNRHNRLPEPAYALQAAQLLADPVGYVAAHRFDVRPASDDRPFFHHYFRWAQTPDVLALFGRTWQPFGGSGYLVLVALLLGLTLLAALLVIGPLAAGRVPIITGSTSALGAARTLAYFAALGFGYLLVLVPLAQRFILLVGDVVTAMAVVFFAVLFMSGIGSLTAPKWRPRMALLALILVVASMPAAIDALHTLALGWDTGWRVAASIAALMPLGLLMGVPFARGLLIVERQAPGVTPWAWAINGSASVLAGVLAVMIAVSLGFRVVLWSGALTYAFALLAIWPLASTEATDRNDPA